MIIIIIQIKSEYHLHSEYYFTPHNECLLDTLVVALYGPARLLFEEEVGQARFANVGQLNFMSLFQQPAAATTIRCPQKGHSIGLRSLLVSWFS